MSVAAFYFRVIFQQLLCFFSLNLLLCSVYFMPVSDGDGSVEMAGNEEEKQGCGTEDAGWI